MFFGFTHCPDVCPTTLLKLAQVTQARRARRSARGVRQRSTRSATPRALLGSYVHAFDPQFVGLTGDAGHDRHARRESSAWPSTAWSCPGGDYTMDHSAVVFLLDDAGAVAAIFTPPFDVRGLGADLRRAAPYLRKARSPG